MIRNFEELLDAAKRGRKQRIVVAVAQDKEVLESVCKAYEAGIIEVTLIGDAYEIRKIADKYKLDISNFKLEDCSNVDSACLLAMRHVRDKKADIPMKGFVDTSRILRALLNKDMNMVTSDTVAHLGVLKTTLFDRLLLLSDSAMIINPSLEQKADLIREAAKVARYLGNNKPNVAILSAVEKVNPKMQSTVDAQKLTEMNESGEITGCLVKGPLALDVAVSRDSAMHKGVIHPVAGHPDIFIAPNIEAGNIFTKTLEYFANAEKAGVIVGAKCPLILTSRSSPDSVKFNSIALAVYIAQKQM